MGRAPLYSRTVRTSALLFGCTMLWSGSVAGQASVTWQAPAGCPSAEESRAEIAQLLGTALADLDAAVSASVRIQRVSVSELEAQIAIRAGGVAAERVLRDPQCAVLAHAAAVIVALALDPATRIPEAGQTAASAGRVEAADVSRARRPASTPARAPEPPSAATPAAPAELEALVVGGAEASAAPRSQQTEAAPPAPRNAAQRARSPARGYAAAAAAFELNILPGVAPLASVAGGLLGTLWRAGLRLSYGPARLALLDEPPDVGGRVAHFAAGIEGGPRWPLSVFEVSLLGGVESGFLSASGHHVSASRTERELWLGVSLGGAASFVWNARIALGLRVDAVAALRRPAFAVQSSLGEEHVFHRPKAMGCRAFLELEVRLW